MSLLIRAKDSGEEVRVRLSVHILVSRGEGLLATNPYEGVAGTDLPPQGQRAEPETELLLARRDKSGAVWSQLARAYLSRRNSGTKMAIPAHRKSMIPAFIMTAAVSPKRSAIVPIQSAPTGRNPKKVRL